MQTLKTLNIDMPHAACLFLTKMQSLITLKGIKDRYNCCLKKPHVSIIFYGKELTPILAFNAGHRAMAYENKSSKPATCTHSTAHTFFLLLLMIMFVSKLAFKFLLIIY